jgi:hypothetical protein
MRAACRQGAAASHNRSAALCNRPLPRCPSPAVSGIIRFEIEPGALSPAGHGVALVHLPRVSTAGTMNEREMLQQKLMMLKSEHRDLDDVIARLGEQAPFDQLQMQRLKKRKLLLKDQISYLENRLVPDIIA